MITSTGDLYVYMISYTVRVSFVEQSTEILILQHGMGLSTFKGKSLQVLFYFRDSYATSSFRI